MLPKNVDGRLAKRIVCPALCQINTNFCYAPDKGDELGHAICLPHGWTWDRKDV